MKSWYASYTQPHNEAVAARHLAQQGFDVFCPRYLKRRSHARRVDMVPAPLFPRYVFVAFDVTTPEWRTVRSTRGVVDLVRNGLQPSPVPDAVIRDIREREDDNGYVVLSRHVGLVRGDPIRIESGPFADHEAIFEAQRDEERVIALLALMGRQVFVEVPALAVMPCIGRPRYSAQTDAKNMRLKPAHAVGRIGSRN